MTRQRLIAILALALGAVAAHSSPVAATAEIIKPPIGEPLRDAAVTRNN